VKPRELEQILSATLADGRLSRSEKQALRQVLDDWSPSAQALSHLRSKVFDAAQQALGTHSPEHVLTWVEEIMKVVLPMAEAAPSESLAQVYFSPSERGRNRIVELIDDSQKSIDICVFTITDNQVSQSILRAHQRGVRVRIITDDLKSEDRGSDIDALTRAGVSVHTDMSDAHMHHKFALFDGGLLLTGSYNWTRSAFTENHENIVVSGDRRLIHKFSEEFTRLWAGPDTGPHHPGR